MLLPVEPGVGVPPRLLPICEIVCRATLEMPMRNFVVPVRSGLIVLAEFASMQALSITAVSNSAPTAIPRRIQCREITVIYVTPLHQETRTARAA